ncbi:MAG: branched-chain amino acid ABC transporter permease, partial [Ruminiclostridium sp.]|nr:branched-chain amino acid ABC transporter permease [Ruminiclostridium sp.]
MSEFISANLPYLLAGISVGGQYALIAIGYTMVYGILRLINFAHGDVFMVAGLVMVYATASLPIGVSVVLVIVATIVLGVAIEKAAYKPLRSAPRMSVMISAIGVSYLLQNCALYFTGGLPQIYPVIPFLSKSVTIGGATTKMVTIVTPILTLVLIFLLVTLIHKTKIGMAMRAVSKSLETA